MISSAHPSGVLARPCASRSSARRIVSSGTLVALSDSTLEVGVDLGLDVAVGTRGDRDSPRELACIFQTLALIVGDGDAPLGQLVCRNYALCHWYLSLGSAAFGAIAGKRYEEARSTSLDLLK
jgi:hypothetical protein